MSKLEVKEIGPISGETDLTLGQSGGTVTLADGATAIGFGLDIDDIPIPEPQIKAWVRFNGIGNPPAIICSQGVSSITDVGTGSWKVNFTNPFPDQNKISAVCVPTNPTGARKDAFIKSYNAGFIHVIFTHHETLEDINGVNLWVTEE